MMQLSREERMLQVESMTNIRDLGGYETQSGYYTKSHKFIRSTNPSKLTDEEKEYLYNYGIRLQIDLRSDFENLIDTLSISLNAPNKEEYYQITRSKYGIDSFDHMLDFASKSKKHVKNVVLTVVDIIGKEKITKCQKIADDLNVVLRVRPFEE